ncbi:hypothetical protein [Thalassotalea sp. PS06]|uniref:hypothetical protein n=1 Tax=Thalassotalea sp. PS06 TaxID=2594005 RepID=UPI001163CAA5|nr:hypothetical protein [Thalassotalea sp. PS06]QDO99923.1 hypothetical protein FNC98_00325 [Thalassotalea sp. PS06]
MEELNLLDAEQVSGGNPVLIGVGIGVGANYVYDTLGGKEGIDSAAEAVVEYFKEAWEYDPVVSMF